METKEAREGSCHESDEELAQVERLFGWLREGGAVHPKVTAARSPWGGRGTFAVEDIKRGEELLTIPKTVILSAKHPRVPIELIKGLEEQGLLEDPFATFCIVLIQQLGDKDSYWAPYFALLPKTFETPLFWTAEDLAFLRHSYIWDEASEIRSNFQDCFNQSMLPFMTKHSNLFPEEIRNFDFFAWVISLVWSRAFHFHDETDHEEYYACVPLADFSNHQNIILLSEEERVVYQAPVVDATKEFHIVRSLSEAADGAEVYQRSAYYLMDDGSQAYRLYSNRNYKKGDEVYNSYGVGNCSDYLIHYGFAGGEDLILKYPTSFLESFNNEKEETAQKKIALFTNIEANLQYFECRRGCLPKVMLASLRIFYMTDEELDRWKEDPEAFKADTVVGEENEKKARRAAIEIFENLVANYVIPEEMPKTEAQRLALDYCKEEKRFLCDTLALLNSNLTTCVHE